MFWTRLASGIVLVIIALLTMSLGGLPLWTVLLLISLVAYRELSKALLCATDDKKLNALEILGFAGVCAYYAAVLFSDEKVQLLMLITAVFMAMMFAYVIAFPKFQAGQVMAGFFSFMYAPVMLSLCI